MSGRILPFRKGSGRGPAASGARVGASQSIGSGPPVGGDPAGTAALIVPSRAPRFRELVLPHLDAAYSLARYLARDATAAEDIAQEAMLRAFRAFETLRGEPKPWLLTLVRNACMTWLKANRPAELSGIDSLPAELLPVEENTPETLALRAVDRRMLNEALAALPTFFREALILRELEDLSYKDIARITDTPIGTVMSRLARARRLLGDSLRAIQKASAPQVHE